MTYELLDLDLKVEAIKNIVCTFKCSPYQISECQSEKDYEVPGWENGADSFSALCMHASYNIGRLPYNQDRKEACHALCRDFENALILLVHNNRSNKQTVFDFAEAMFFLELDDIVIEQLEKVFKELSTLDENSLPDSRHIPDFAQLLMRAGDKYLFFDQNQDKAMRLYALAAKNWPFRNFRAYINSSQLDETSGFSPALKRKWRQMVNAFVSIINGEKVATEAIKEFSSSCQTILNHYNSIISLHSSHEDCAQEINNLSKLISSETQNMIRTCRYSYANYSGTINDLCFQTFRISFLIAMQLVKIGLVDIIANLASENKEVQSIYETKAYEKLRFLYGTEYSPIADNLQTPLSAPTQTEIKLMYNVIGIVQSIKRIKNKLRVKTTDQDYAYYTTWETFSYMLPEKSEKENIGHLSVMHVAYMNDPMEGKVLKQYIFGSEGDEKEDRSRIEQPYVFFKCFTKQIDYLPMWSMYGNSASGCCIVFNLEETFKRTKGKSIDLYRICYLKKNRKGGYDIRKETGNDYIWKLGIKEDLTRLKSQISEIEGRYISMVKRLLDGIAYLFKDSSYSYEGEARVMYNFTSPNSKIEHTRQTPPKLFVRSEFPMVIKEIILGPKFKNVSEWIPHIKEQIDKLSQEIGIEAPKITISNIDYR